MRRHQEPRPSLCLSILLLGALATAGCGAEEQAFARTVESGMQQATLGYGGHQRSYMLYVPAVLAEEPAVVLVLHGSGGTAERIRMFTDRRFERLADRDGNPSTGIERRVWAGRESEVVLITVPGGGHTIPQTEPSEARFPAFAGPQSREIDAVLEAWSFFQRHRDGF